MKDSSHRLRDLFLTLTGVVLGLLTSSTAVGRRRVTTPATARVTTTADPPVAPSVVREPLHPGWHRLPEEALPRPTYWPVVLAVGILGVAWGLVSSVLVLVVGLVLFVLACAGWTRDLRHADP